MKRSVYSATPPRLDSRGGMPSRDEHRYFAGFAVAVEVTPRERSYAALKTLRIPADWPMTCDG